jgi:hypothetical protein
MQVLDLRVVSGEGLSLPGACQLALASAARFPAMTAMS